MIAADKFGGIGFDATSDKNTLSLAALDLDHETYVTF
jgi:hypothetical protein